MVISGVILRVVYVILMNEMVVGGDSYEKCCWKCSRNHCGTMGNHHGDPRGDPRGDPGRDLIFWKCLPM